MSLRLDQDRYHEFYDEMDGGICIIQADESEQILFVNRTVPELYGCRDEAEFYAVFSAISLIYAAVLIVAAMGQIHEYSAGKNLLFTVATLFAMLVMVFILMLFFSMISQGVAYFISLGRELLFRM